MANRISLLPDVLDLVLYAGDGVEIRVLCTDSAGAPIDITGVVSAQIRLERLAPDPPIASFEINTVDAYAGKIILKLTGQQTEDLVTDPSAKAGKFVGVWDLQWAPAGSEPRTMCQGKVECTADVTR
jgi:hypothetical protein